ncbi:MAG: ATP-binding protein [Myxococcota bacterium]
MAEPTLHGALLSRLLAFALLASALVVAVELVYQGRDLDAELERRARAIAHSVRILAEAVPGAVERQRALEGLASQPEVVGLALLQGAPGRVAATSHADWRGQTLAELVDLRELDELAARRSSGADQARVEHLDGQLVLVTSLSPLPQATERRTEARILVVLDSTAAHRALDVRSLRFSSVLAFVVLVFGLLASWVTQRFVVAPLRSMAEAVRRQAAGETTAPVPTRFAVQEFNAFAGLLNEMVRTRSVAHRKLKRSEAELRLLGQITRIGDRAGDFDEALRSCCAQVCRFLLWPIGHVYVRDEDEPELLRPSDIWYVSCPELASEFVERTGGRSFRAGEDLPGRVLERREPVWVEDCWEEDWFERSLPGEGIVRAAVGFPIFMAREVVAVLELFDLKPREREVRPLALMHNVGLTIGQVLQRRRSHELLLRRNRELVDAMQVAVSATNAKTAFLANMSHEIRTPLTSIIGYSELLQGAKSQEERDEFAATIRRNGEILLQLIDDILDVSKIEAGRLEIERIGCSPAGIVQNVVEAMAPRAREKGIEFVVRNDGPIPETIISDPTRLRQVLLNLISNAIKFTSRGRVELTVGLATPADAPHPLLRFAIRDTGIGIRSSQLERIFSPFSQADMSTTRRFGGTGLGLSISRNLTTLLGGELDAESEESVGSCFSFTVATGPLDEVRMLDGLPGVDLLECADEVRRREARLDGARVLLAEDGPDNQRLLRRILTAARAEVEIAENGAVACERALAEQAVGRPFDAILMDIQMPVMDGHAATMSLRQQGYSRPIIALTANAMKGDRERCLAAGCDDFVSKPVKKSVLIRVLREHLGLS